MTLRIEGFVASMREGATIDSNWRNQSLGLQAYFDLLNPHAMEIIATLLRGTPVELRYRPEVDPATAEFIATSLRKAGFVCAFAEADQR